MSINWMELNLGQVFIVCAVCFVGLALIDSGRVIIAKLDRPISLLEGREKGEKNERNNDKV